jgi:hypothetical protein
MVAAPTHDEVWERLFACALVLIDDVRKHGDANLFWTFGGGTVLMRRYNHRRSKDIDIFFHDPQPLGFVTPRLSDVAESLTTEYVEAAQYVKLFLPDGEIDFVASPNLTSPGFEMETIQGVEVRVETSVEIIAKKMWHRGDHITARDIFDYVLISEREHSRLMAAAPYLLRHADAIEQAVRLRSGTLRIQFDAIETLDFHPSFEHACNTLLADLKALKK